MSHRCHRSVLLAIALLLFVSWSCAGPGNTPETTTERFFEGYYAATEKLIDPELSPKDRAALLSWTRDDLLSPLAGGWLGGGRMYEVLPGHVAVTKMELTEIGVPRISSRDRSQAGLFVRGKYSAAGRVTSHKAYQRLDGGGISLLDKRTDSVTFEDKPSGS